MSWNFDKFMKRILEEKPQEKKPTVEQTPQQRYNELYREKWQNRIRWNRK